MKCTFCTNVSTAGELVFEDENSWVLLHPDRSPRGHAMVVAKRHVENASDLPDDEWIGVARVWHRVERILLEVTRSERAIIMKLGIATPHLHLHIYPVATTDTRADVFAAIDGKRSDARDEQFIETLRRLLTPPTA